MGLTLLALHSVVVPLLLFLSYRLDRIAATTDPYYATVLALDFPYEWLHDRVTHHNEGMVILGEFILSNTEIGHRAVISILGGTVRVLLGGPFYFVLGYFGTLLVKVGVRRLRGSDGRPR